MRRLGLLVILAACSGDTAGGPVALAFTSPSPGASFTREIVGTNGALVAAVPVTVAIEGSPARVGLAVAGSPLPSRELDGSGNGLAEVRTAGTATLVATAYDDDGADIAGATVDVTIGDPVAADCHAWLDLYGVAYTLGPAMMGVADPVRATIPINGLSYRVVGGANPRQTMFGDCRIILSLAHAAAFMRDRGITEVTDYGVYNYRCIGSGTPPDCPSGLSQHAFATAIDLAGFTDGAGTNYSVNDDWVIDPDSEETCDAPTEAGKDTFLHELICTMKAAKLWNIVLTPSYNADHRNHFHVDLTPGSDFIERTAIDEPPFAAPAASH
jgi:hypothetical protein